MWGGMRSDRRFIFYTKEQTSIDFATFLPYLNICINNTRANNKFPFSSTIFWPNLNHFTVRGVIRKSVILFLRKVRTRVSTPMQQFQTIWQSAYFLHSSYWNGLCATGRKLCISHGESGSKDLKQEILIWTTTIVRMHRENWTNDILDWNLVADLNNKILNLERRKETRWRAYLHT